MIFRKNLYIFITGFIEAVGIFEFGFMSMQKIYDVMPLITRITNPKVDTTR